MSRNFADTNIIGYSFVNGRRRPAAAAIMATRPVISVQVLNEFANIARKKFGFEWQQIDTSVSHICRLSSEIVPLTLAIHDHGRRLSERYQLSVYDGFIIAAALSANCDILYSEDMHDGLVIDDRMTIRNPFLRD